MQTRLLVTTLPIVFAAMLALAAPAQASRNLYVAGFTSSNVAAFDFTPSGGLSQIGGSPFAAGLNASPTVMTPDGRHLYVAGSGGVGTVTAYDVAANGALSQLAGSPFTSSGAQGLVATADGRHLYVANVDTAGTVSAFEIAAGGSLAPLGNAPAGDNPSILVATPDSRHLYAMNIGVAANNISVYDIAANGTLSAGPGSPVPAGSSPRGAAVTPDGAHLYVTNQSSSNLYAFDIAANGALSPVPGSPFTAGTASFGVAITPDGRHAYVPNHTDDNVFAYDIAANGALNPIPGSPFGNAGTDPISIALTPDGNRLYVGDQNSTVAAFNVATNGILTPVAGSPFPAGVTGPDLESISITPDQGPRAALSVKSAAPGSATRFDGTGSSDPDGTVASFAWDFGDGAGKTGSTATTTHSYAKAGVYTAKLTVTDNEGCSSAQIFTGQAVSCNGGAAAVRTATIDTPPSISGLGVTNKRFAVASARTKRVKRGTTFRYRLSEVARVTFTISRKTTGRRVGESCRKATRKNGNRRRCTRYVTAGTFTVRARRGLNRKAFSGRLRGRKLKPGSYRVSAVGKDKAGGKSRPRSAAFKVVPGPAGL